MSDKELVHAIEELLLVNASEADEPLTEELAHTIAEDTVERGHEDARRFGELTGREHFREAS